MIADPTKFTDVIYEVRDRAAWIIINRPKVYNAFRGQTLEELIQAFQIAANDRNISSIVLTGAGDKAFCSGGDQKERAASGYAAAAPPRSDMNSRRFIRSPRQQAAGTIRGSRVQAPWRS